MVTELVRGVGLAAACALPLWNIPLMLRIERRKSSKDLDVAWAFGVWGCLVAMLPAGLASPDVVFRVFAILNVVLFTGVVVQVVRYR